MRLLFLGTPAFAVPALRALHAAGHEVALVVTRPDRPRGRSASPEPPEVKAAAVELSLPIYQPDGANRPETVSRLRPLKAQLGIVVAYGEVLSPELLAVTEQGFLNLHASLLPGYRGAAPINWALIRGERVTGVSIIRMTPRLDAGPILAERRVDVGPTMTAGELSERLAHVGAQAMVEVVGRLEAGEEIAGRPQPPRGGFFARKLTKEDGRLDWRLSAGAIADRVRGLTPWPGAYCDFVGGGRAVRSELRLRVLVLQAACALPGEGSPTVAPGVVLRADPVHGILVNAGEGAVLVMRLKPAGGREMDAAAFINGYRASPGDRFE